MSRACLVFATKLIRCNEHTSKASAHFRLVVVKCHEKYQIDQLVLKPHLQLNPWNPKSHLRHARVLLVICVLKKENVLGVRDVGAVGDQPLDRIRLENGLQIALARVAVLGVTHRPVGRRVRVAPGLSSAVLTCTKSPSEPTSAEWLPLLAGDEILVLDFLHPVEDRPRSGLRFLSGGSRNT